MDKVRKGPENQAVLSRPTRRERSELKVMWFLIRLTNRVTSELRV